MGKQQNQYYEKPNVLDFHSALIEIKKEPPFLWVKPAVNYFYPGGGGQERDFGTINGNLIEDIKKSDSEIWFRLPSDVTLSENEPCHFQIDKEHRLASSQSHSAQHLISAVFYREFGMNTLSVHLNDSYFTIEFDQPFIEKKRLNQVLQISNEMIREAIPIFSRIVEKKELANLDIRRPSKAEENIRVVFIGEYDRVPCGGLHVKSSAQLQCIHYLRSETIRGHSRIYFTTGIGAFKSFEQNHAIVNTLQTQLSTPPQEITDRVEELRAKTVVLNSQVERTIEMWLDAKMTAHQNESILVIRVPSELSFKTITKIAAKKDHESYIIFQPEEQLIFIKFSSKECLLFNKIEESRKQGLIRGGGKFPFFQGQLQNPDTGNEFFDQLLNNYQE